MMLNEWHEFRRVYQFTALVKHLRDICCHWPPAMIIRHRHTRARAGQDELPETSGHSEGMAISHSNPWLNSGPS